MNLEIIKAHSGKVAIGFLLFNIIVIAIIPIYNRVASHPDPANVIHGINLLITIDIVILIFSLFTKMWKVVLVALCFVILGIITFISGG